MNKKLHFFHCLDLRYFKCITYEKKINIASIFIYVKKKNVLIFQVFVM